MYINEITSGSTIKIIVNSGVTRLEFETKAVEGIITPVNGLIVEAVRTNEKMINFSSKGIVCGIFVIDNQTKMPYQWRIVNIHKIKVKGIAQHVILTRQEVLPYNRRAYFRVWIWLAAILQVGKNQETYDVTIRDISANGISFVCSKNIDILEGGLIHVSFFDEVTGTSFNITALTVRKLDFDEQRVIFGCKLNVEVMAINRFIQQKQRERAKIGINSGIIRK